MSDCIKIKDLHLRSIVGINEWERREKQDILINVNLYTNLKKAGKTDNIKETIDYKTVKNEIINIIEGSSFFLIETMAHKIAELCIRKNGVKKVEVEVDKPGALRFARSVSVKLKMEWKTFVISIGSNIEPQRNIIEAINKIKKISDIKILKISNFLETSHINEHGEYDFSFPKFINGVLKIETFLEKDELEEKLYQIEKELGRKEKGSFSPRTIDLDIVLIKDSDENIKFFSKDIYERNFLYFLVIEVENDIGRFPIHTRENFIREIKSGLIKKVDLGVKAKDI